MSPKRSSASDCRKDRKRCRRSINAHTLAQAAVILLTLATPRFVRAQTEPAVPVTDPLVKARCGTCHGFFTPAAANPGVNDDVWIIATAKNEKSSDGKPLVGKSYLVVTVPTYTFYGRTYVRDLDRWIEEGSSRR